MSKTQILTNTQRKPDTKQEPNINKAITIAATIKTSYLNIQCLYKVIVKLELKIKDANLRKVKPIVEHKLIWIEFMGN